MNNRPISLITLVVILLLITACQSKINKTNFESIKSGMSYEQVNAILGTPSSSTSLSFGNTTGTSARWENRNGSIVIQFFNDKVKVKQFTDGVSTPRED